MGQGYSKVTVEGNSLDYRTKPLHELISEFNITTERSSYHKDAVEYESLKGRVSLSRAYSFHCCR